MPTNHHSDPEANVDEMFELSNAINELGKDWAEKNHAASMLEETKIIVRAEIANRIRAESPHINKRDAEVAALVSPEYKQHVNAMVVARTVANIAKANLETARTQFEATRTAEVSRRAEMSRFSSR